jgi:tetratricopeptide (TPR) repeat protein
MNKGNLMSLALGLIVGLVVGFIFANNYDRSAGRRTVAVDSATPVPGQSLPPNHPPVANTSAPEQDGQSNPVPQVAAAIEKAKSQPQNYEAQMTAADLYYQIQRFPEAAQFYEAAAKLKPSDTEPMIKAGNAYFDGEKYEAAQKWYEQALQKEPKNADVMTDLGLSFFLREPRDIDRAIKEYTAALAVKPEHEFALQNLALAYTEKGDRANFQATLERLRKVNPKNPVVTKSDAPQ